MSKFKVGDKVKTRGGQDVEIICIDERLKQPVVGLFCWGDGAATCHFWNKDGSFIEVGDPGGFDIIPLPRTVTLYRAVIRTPEGRCFTPSHLFSGLDDNGIEDWNSGGCEFIRLLTEYPIEVEL
jgi:hypothetical protein